MIAKIITFAFVFILLGLECAAQVSATDSLSSKVITEHGNKNALRFSLSSERLLQAYGAKHWFSEEFAISGHFVAAYSHSEEKVGTGLLIAREVALYGGLYAQGEYHWLRGGKALTQNISPYFAAGIGIGISESSSWFIAGSILIGAEIFLTPSLSIAVEQGVDISYAKFNVFYSTEPFLSLLPFSKAGNNRLLLHIYF